MLWASHRSYGRLGLCDFVSSETFYSQPATRRLSLRPSQPAVTHQSTRSLWPAQRCHTPLPTLSRVAITMTAPCPYTSSAELLAAPYSTVTAQLLGSHDYAFRAVLLPCSTPTPSLPPPRPDFTPSLTHTLSIDAASIDATASVAAIASHDDKQCLPCHQAPVTVRLVPCGHDAFCGPCYRRHATACWHTAAATAHRLTARTATTECAAGTTSAWSRHATTAWSCC